MTRTIVVLDVIVLVVTFLLALSATDSQIGLMQSASEIANVRAPSSRAAATTPDSSIACLRVVQSLDSIAPHGADEALQAEKLRVIHEVVRTYRDTIDRGVAGILSRSAEGQVLRQAYAELGRGFPGGSQDEALAALLRPAFMKRLTTEIIEQCG